MCKHFLLSVVLLFAALPVLAQETQAPPPAPETTAIPAQASHKTNPVKATPESIAEGKKYYGYDCAMCHGANGDGKGDLAIEQKLTIGDFRNPATLKDVTDGDLYYIISTGKGHNMPPEATRSSNPNLLWNIINYVRSLAKAQ